MKSLLLFLISTALLSSSATAQSAFVSHGQSSAGAFLTLPDGILYVSVGSTRLVTGSPVSNTNNAPLFDGSLPNLALQVGDPNVLIDLATLFSDPDADPLTFGVSSNLPSSVSAVLAGSILTISAVDVGTAEITVSANDGRGGVIETQFEVAVGENSAPIVTDGIIDQELKVGGSVFSIENLTPLFFDADNDPLSYSASSNDLSVAIAGVAGNTLSVAPIGEGTAEVTVAADDGHGGTASIIFTVTVVLATAVGDPVEIPVKFAVRGNYPNPFNPSTTILFDLAEPASVRIEIVDVMGHMVLVVPDQRFDAGSSRHVTVDVSHLSSGSYFYRVIASSTKKTELGTGRMTLVK